MLMHHDRVKPHQHPGLPLMFTVLLAAACALLAAGCSSYSKITGESGTVTIPHGATVAVEVSGDCPAYSRDLLRVDLVREFGATGKVAVIPLGGGTVPDARVIATIDSLEPPVLSAFMWLGFPVGSAVVDITLSVHGSEGTCGELRITAKSHDMDSRYNLRDDEEYPNDVTRALHRAAWEGVRRMTGGS